MGLSKRIQELSIPKGLENHVYCELCQKKASTKCDMCKVTHYCTKEHKDLDWHAFHKSVCAILSEIRQTHVLPFTEEQRNAIDDNVVRLKRECVRLGVFVTRRWLLRRMPTLAYPSALVAWNVTCSLHHPHQVGNIVPACLVAEMFLELGEEASAEDYMIQASWISQKHDVISAEILSRLHRLRGLVLMARGGLELACVAFTEFSYTEAAQHGLTSLRLGIPMGLLGLVHLKLDNVDGAVACFHRMADRWLEYYLDLFQDINLRSATESDMLAHPDIAEMEFQCMEVKKLLESVYEAVRPLGMDIMTDLINFKILVLQALSYIRENKQKAATVYKQEAVAAGARTLQEEAVHPDRMQLITKILEEDVIELWRYKHIRPRTCATKYLEFVKAMVL